METDRISFRAEEELIEFEAPGNAGIDNLLIYSSTAGGRILQNSTIITTNNLFEIDHNGAIDSSLGAITINEHVIDLAGITIDDGGAAATILRGYIFEGRSIAPAGVGVGLSTLVGMELQMPVINGSYGGVGTGAMYITENTNDAIMEIMNASGNVIAISGDTANDGRVWVTIAPSATTVNADVNNTFIEVDIAALVLDDDANTPEYRGIRLDMISGTETEVDGTVLYGQEILMPDVSGYATAAGLRVSENATDYIVEIINNENNAIKLSGVEVNESRDWFDIQPDTAILNTGSNITFMKVYLNNLTIDDGATTPTINCLFMDLDEIIETEVDGTDLYGITIHMPDISTYADGAAFHAQEVGNDSIVEIINSDNNAIYIAGDSIETRDWFFIQPTIQTINAASVIRYMHLDTDNLTIEDGATAPDIYGMHLLMNNITETDVNLTDLWGIYVNISATLANYADGAAGYFTDGTQSVKILDGTTALTVVGGLALDTLDLTPTTNVDALDINLENDAFVSASAIDIDIGDYTGGNIIDIAFTQASTITADTNIIKIDGANLTTNTAANDLHAIDIDWSTVVDTDFNTFYGINITMPVAYQGIDPTSALHATGESLIVDIITNDEGISITGTSVDAKNWLLIQPDISTLIAANTINYIAVDTDNIIIDDGTNALVLRGAWFNLDTMTETIHANTTLHGIYIEAPDDMAGYLQAYGIYVENATHSVRILNDGVDALNWAGDASGDTLDLTPTTNVDVLDIDLTNDAWTSASAIDIDIGDWIGGSNIIDIAATQAGTIATNAAIISIDAGTNITFSDAGAATQYFYGFDLDMSAITAANANMAGMAGLNITMPANGHACWGANKVSAIHATGNGNVFDALLGDGIKLDMGEAGSVGLVIESDTIGTVANAMQTLNTSRDFAGVTTADIAMTNYSVTHGVVNVNTPTTDFDFDFESGVVNLIMQQTNASTFAT